MLVAYIEGFIDSSGTINITQMNNGTTTNVALGASDPNALTIFYQTFYEFMTNYAIGYTAAATVIQPNMYRVEVQQ